MRNTLTAALRAIRSRIRGERLDAQAQQVADIMVEELRAAVADLKETRQEIREFGKAMGIPDGVGSSRKGAEIIDSARTYAVHFSRTLACSSRRK